MKRSRLLLFACLLLFPFLAVAQESGQPRLSAGSLVTIPPEVDYENTHNRADMVELLAALPDVDPAVQDDIRFDKEVWAKNVRFQRDVWCLQFSFKPMRIVEVDIPNKEGTLDRKAVWYLIYNVKNVGPADLSTKTVQRTITVDGAEQVGEFEEYALGNPGGALGSEVETTIATPVIHDTTAEKCNCEFCQGTGPSTTHTRDTAFVLQNMPGSFKPRPGKDEPIQFVPQFVFAIERLVLGTTSENDPETGKRESYPDPEPISISYVDQIIPIALPIIGRREGMQSLPEHSVSIARRELKSGEDVWGVAMWTDVDPRVNRFSIYVSGLTNIYRWRENIEGSDRIKDRKTLKINWWRRGDRFSLSEREIQYGFPGEVDYEWIFR